MSPLLSSSPVARRATGPLQGRSRFIAGPARERHQDSRGNAPPLFRPPPRHFAPLPTVPPRTAPSRDGTGRRTSPSRNGAERRIGLPAAGAVRRIASSLDGSGRRINPPLSGNAPQIPLPERKTGRQIIPLSPPPSLFLSFLLFLTEPPYGPPSPPRTKKKDPAGSFPFGSLRRMRHAADAPRPVCGPAAWRCARSTQGSRAPPLWPNRWWARRSTAPRDGSTRASRA